VVAVVPEHVAAVAVAEHVAVVVVPGHAAAVPEHAAAVPGHAAAVPGHAAVVPEHVSAVPGHAVACVLVVPRSVVGEDGCCRFHSRLRCYSWQTPSQPAQLAGAFIA
jgi:hypothetical protein